MKPITASLLVAIISAIFMGGCEKPLIDYRNKWIGDWRFEVEFSSSSSWGVQKHEEDGRVDFGDESSPHVTNGKAIRINGRTYGVTREGNLYHMNLRTGDAEKVGSIDRKKLAITESNSSGNYGERWVIQGTRND